MNPPVDAPASRHPRPVGSIANASRAAASFSPPRETKGCAGPSTTSASSVPTSVVLFVAARAPAPSRVRRARLPAPPLGCRRAHGAPARRRGGRRPTRSFPSTTVLEDVRTGCSSPWSCEPAGLLPRADLSCDLSSSSARTSSSAPVFFRPDAVMPVARSRSRTRLRSESSSPASPRPSNASGRRPPCAPSRGDAARAGPALRRFSPPGPWPHRDRCSASRGPVLSPGSADRSRHRTSSGFPPHHRVTPPALRVVRSQGSAGLEGRIPPSSGPEPVP